MSKKVIMSDQVVGEHCSVQGALHQDSYQEGYSFPREVLFDKARMKRLFHNKWCFVGTRGDVPDTGSYLSFRLFENSYFLIHGTDGVIRCMVNRCAHQSAHLVTENVGKCPAKIMCPNHQWTYNLDDGSLYHAPRMSDEFVCSDAGKASSLDNIKLEEVAGMLFMSLGEGAPDEDIQGMRELLDPYVGPFHLDKEGYKLAYHEREVLDANWLTVMINNRECCHCQMNHKGLLKLFSDSSFNGGREPSYMAAFSKASERWDDKGLLWKEKAFDEHDCCRIARYPMKEGFKSTSFDGKPCSAMLIGPHKEYDEGTLSFWLNPNAWVHFTSDHIATNWVLPIDEHKCILYTSWIVHKDAVEGVDYEKEHLTSVWKVTNSEDVALCRSMTQGAYSAHYRPGPFSDDERHCTQFCNWYMKYSR
ncbi:MAG TPA: aromatic ring-hydroxylating dioxygenase subunit alpha [Candidatus Thioglobus sp.]|nr:aromatic ring-hydroxylating dioxygenase subunit alpha [Candidatus Thioglobus sp.]HIL20509.1 aromatic ring-hydroxylating dioxygenase subunit alpha [Candidatus Thioglobus sp.]